MTSTLRELTFAPRIFATRIFATRIFATLALGTFLVLPLEVTGQSLALGLPFEAGIVLEVNELDDDATLIIFAETPLPLLSLRVIAPSGEEILDVEAGEEGLGLPRFELEPVDSSIRNTKDAFPAGMYLFDAVTIEGDQILAVGTLSHESLPAPLLAIAPRESLDGENLLFRWQEVSGAAAYVFHIEHSALALDVYWRVDATTLAIALPPGLLPAATDYEVSLTAIGENGNRSMADTTFDVTFPSTTDSPLPSARQFKDRGVHPFITLEPGKASILTGRRNAARIEFEVLPQTAVIDGVVTRLVEERESINDVVCAVTRRWIAIDSISGDLVCFGESGVSHRTGRVTRHHRFGEAPWVFLPGRSLERTRLLRALIPSEASIGILRFGDVALLLDESTGSTSFGLVREGDFYTEASHDTLGVVEHGFIIDDEDDDDDDDDDDDFGDDD